eukprot:9490343-Pyramimonas_sp.AAC.1
MSRAAAARALVASGAVPGAAGGGARAARDGPRQASVPDGPLDGSGLRLFLLRQHKHGHMTATDVCIISHHATVAGAQGEFPNRFADAHVPRTPFLHHLTRFSFPEPSFTLLSPLFFLSPSLPLSLSLRPSPIPLSLSLSLPFSLVGDE